MGNYRLGMECNECRGTYLAHHGIKGQKWGVRRYQNPDGSLTEEGKARYSDENLFDQHFRSMSKSVHETFANSGNNDTSQKKIPVNKSVIDAYKRSVKNAIINSGSTKSFIDMKYLEGKTANSKKNLFNFKEKGALKKQLAQKKQELDRNLKKSMIMAANMVYDDLDIDNMKPDKKREIETVIYSMLSNYGEESTNILNESFAQALFEL